MVRHRLVLAAEIKRDQRARPAEDALLRNYAATRNYARVVMCRSIPVYMNRLTSRHYSQCMYGLYSILFLIAVLSIL